MFDAYFERNVPGPGETVVAIVDGRVYDQRSSERGGTPRIAPLVPRWAGLTRTERGTAGTEDGEVRYVAVPITGDGARGTFVVISALAGEREEVTDAVRVAALVLVSVLALAAALAWVLAGRILAPLQELRATARSITQTDITRRIPVTGTDEIAELARTFNAMLDRLEASFGSLESAVASQRAFVSDASHELRTPITIVRGHLELLGDDPQERRETVALVTDELDRMSRFVDDLLVLAKAEREDFLHIAPLELGALTDELLDKAAGLGRRDWRLEHRGERLLHADRQRLTQAVMGLAQNAVQHTRRGRADLARLRRRRRRGAAVGPRRRPRGARGGPRADLRALRPRPAAAPGGPRAPGSASRSCARSPRRTAAAWSSTRTRRGARPSRSCSPRRSECGGAAGRPPARRRHRSRRRKGFARRRARPGAASAERSRRFMRTG